jgi:signal peptidase II
MEVRINGELAERHGVVDFLQFYYNWADKKYWPIFNVADSALVCGVALLLIFLHFHGAEVEQDQDQDQNEGAEAEAGEAA